MGRGNIKIDESMTKTVVGGKIIIPLPTVLVGNRYYPMFSISSPTHCDNCGNKLHVNSHYTRFILSSHGIIALDITYWTCPACKKHLHDQIIGVPGSANYSYEFYEKQMSVRGCLKIDFSILLKILFSPIFLSLYESSRHI